MKEDHKQVSVVFQPVDTFIGRARAIEASLDMTLEQNERLTRQRNELSSTIDLVFSGQDSLSGKVPSPEKLGHLIRTSVRALGEITIAKYQPEVVCSALFLGLFSVFDAFLGELTRCLFAAKNELLRSLPGHIDALDIAGMTSIDQARSLLIERYVDSLRRESYIEQFSILEKTFGISTLKKFQAWNKFVEMSQRRNVIAHCDGKTSIQYITQCRSAGCDLGSVSLGERLTVSKPYLEEACRLLMDIAVRLAYTLSGKLVPSESHIANQELTSEIFRALSWEEWERAASLARFTLDLFKHRDALDRDRRIAVVNLAIAIRYSIGVPASMEIMSREDWSSCALEFKLADAILCDNPDLAASIMIMIGKRSEMLQQHAYYAWPLFREFCTHPKFQESYKKVYGRDYIVDLKSELKRSVSGACQATNDGQDLATNDGQDLATNDGQDSATNDGQDLATNDGQDLATNNGQDLATNNGQDLATNNGQDLATNDGQDLATNDGQDLATNNGHDLTMANRPHLTATNEPDPTAANG